MGIVLLASWFTIVRKAKKKRLDSPFFLAIVVYMTLWTISKKDNSTDYNVICSFQIASEGLKHRVFEVSLADLQNDEDNSFRKIRLRAEDVQGRNVLTNFYGMDFTTDKLRSLVKKWQSLIEAHVDVKTTDSYTLRMFCIGFTKKRPNQQKRTCYAQSSQIRQVNANTFFKSEQVLF